MRAFDGVYHVQLRQFPHNLCRFNLDERELRAIVEPWMRDPWVELGERKWIPHHARLTILEGPRLPLEQLTMGRGWSAAQRESENVTERVLEAAKPAAGAAPEPPPQQPPPEAALVADSLGLELLALLAKGPAPLSQAWRLAATRFTERSPSESLALAERAVGSLLQARLIVLAKAPAGDAPGHSESEPQLAEAEVETLLRAPAGWSDQGERRGVLMHRA